jgi:pimeloyl-[acyl-carrier protein] methyl ester esterase
MGKPKLITLPGWGMPPDVWLPLQAGLAAYYDFVPVDWAGINTVSGFAQKSLSVIMANQPGPASLMGWSLGAVVALEVAIGYPGLVDRLILFGGTSRFVSDKAGGYHCGCPARVVKRLKASLINDRENTLLNFYQAMFAEHEIEKAAAARFKRSIGERAPAHPLPSLLAGLDYLMQADYRERLKLIKAPLLLIHGAADRICPLGAVDEILFRVTTETNCNVLPEAGHMPFFTYPDRCVRMIMEFTSLNRGGAHD